MPDLLIELFSEEIPARMQARARDDLRRLVTDGMVAAGLTYAHARAYSTPRRLALAVEGLAAASPALSEERKGPRADAPAAAIEGFLRATGLTREALETRDTGKGAVLFARIERPGRAAAAIVAEVLERTIRDFPWPKSMRWGDGSAKDGALRWVRPLQSILCILTTESGAEIVPLEIAGLAAGDSTRGHRFMAPAAFRVTSFEDYAAKLKRAHVILDSAEREAQIRHEAESLAFAAGCELVDDPGLLAEVAGLVEWPVVLMGEIGADFLSLPPEVLQTSMRSHQKFFSVRNPKSGRIERFVTVANRDTADHGATVLAGNSRVLAARLSDARFFWENDLRTVKTVGMEGMAEGLAEVTFHNKLGSQAERMKRIEALAREIAPLVGAKPDLAAEAARIAKADLQSQMVGEFPELEGLMGRYYAEAAGHDDGVPQACEEHYKPLGPSDEVPAAPVSVAVALADKIDTLTGFWAIDEKPTGSKDPFALRRAALGVIRLVLGNGLTVQLSSLLRLGSVETFTSQALAGKLAYLHYYEVDDQTGRTTVEEWRNFTRAPSYDEVAEVQYAPDDIVVLDRAESRAIVETHQIAWLQDVDASGNHLDDESECIDISALTSDLLAFFHDRLKVHLRDEGIRHDVIDAVLAMPNADDLTLVVKRAEALAAFLKTDDGENLILGFRRAHKLLAQAEAKDGVEYSYGADPKFAENPTETALFAALDAAEKAIAPAMEQEDFPAAMAAMAALRAPIDAFFDTVQINTENQTVRRNRLNLLHRIRTTCLAVADLTKLEG